VVLSAADVPAGTEYRDHLELEGNEALVLEPL
jgi:hypothetical protein